MSNGDSEVSDVIDSAKVIVRQPKLMATQRTYRHEHMQSCLAGVLPHAPGEHASSGTVRNASWGV
jgi:hypothetical protein